MADPIGLRRIGLAFSSIAVLVSVIAAMTVMSNIAP